MEEDELFKAYLYQTIDRLCLPSRATSAINKAIAAQYFIHEMPILLNTPAILGVPSSCLLYHKADELFKYFYNPNMNMENQGCISIYIHLAEDLQNNKTQQPLTQQRVFS